MAWECTNPQEKYTSNAMGVLLQATLGDKKLWMNREIHLECHFEHRTPRQSYRQESLALTVDLPFHVIKKKSNILIRSGVIEIGR